MVSARYVVPSPDVSREQLLPG
ncbi:hypothetical protein NPIL_510581, partial [Nephila pilipes]